MTPKQIIELIGGTKSNISQRLNSLEKKGYIKMRKSTGKDKRMLFVELSPLGRKKLQEMKKHLNKVKLELESNFIREEIQKHFAFFDKLNKLVDSREKKFSQCKKLFCK